MMIIRESSLIEAEENFRKERSIWKLENLCSWVMTMVGVAVLVVGYQAAGQTILDTFPLLDGLTNCSFVTNTVSIIVTQQCKAVNTAINHLWIAFVVMSSLLVFLIAFWDIANRLNAEQHYLVTVIPQDTVPYNSGPYSVIVK
jgi:hypothetical protein